MRSTIVLVRHAQPFPPRPGGPGDDGRSLTEEGKAHAERLGFGYPGVNRGFSQAMPMPAIYRIEFHDDRVRSSGPGLRPEDADRG
ncbi:hypothetical protein OHA40_34495 [Nocardia sp. NBC_00508]|uniref:hypothetical protein n=1 Tax=Nocardia sp. NBC_00508 TaxID=2975992 RepID=UPI002E8072B1|nr:hypothetical protein [Nocardia sp. NBC_00508]WUD66585.1 hypothetical protein OHA40_34495 [Nocardia sp. NBC_00508]